jgi:hypothetical protein
MTQEEIVDKARRDFETAASKVGKVGYLAGNGNEKQAAQLYHKWAALNNALPNRPHAVTLKKKYRRG